MKWYYQDTEYCRPIFTYTELNMLMDSVDSKKFPKLYAKLLHYRNKIDEKRIVKGCNETTK